MNIKQQDPGPVMIVSHVKNNFYDKPLKCKYHVMLRLKS